MQRRHRQRPRQQWQQLHPLPEQKQLLQQCQPQQQRQPQQLPPQQLPPQQHQPPRQHQQQCLPLPQPKRLHQR
jgi:hypothetical protein